MVRRIEIPESDLTLEQIEHFSRVIQQTDGHRLTHIRVGGGEPLIWGPEKIRSLVEHFEALAEVEHIEIQTNWTLRHRMTVHRRRRGRPRIRWTGRPPEQKDHQPWLISPSDLGIGGLSRCWVRRGCGWAFEAWGFTYCTVAGILGRLLRIDPYSSEPQRKVDQRICAHCIYSVPRQVGLLLRSLVYERKINYPTPTLQKGLEDYQRDPVIFRRAD
jgi:hypothetical protein